MSQWFSIATFEWRFQRRSPVFWVGAVIFFLLTFGATTVDQIQIGARGNVHVNAPYAIVQTTGIMMLFALFVVVAMVAGAVVRDDETGFAPILRTTRLGRVPYLLGRFAGACAAALLVVACVPLAIALGAAMPWQDPEKIGAFHLAHYLWTLLCFVLPTLLVVASALFALATATRSMVWCQVGAVALIVAHLVMRGLLRDPRFDTVSALVDPFGLSALQIVTRYWTAAERNTLLPELSGLLLANRALWAGVGLALLAATVWRFRFAQPGRSAPAKATAADPAPAPRSAGTPLPALRAGAATRRAQLWALARYDMAFVFRSPAFFVLLGIGLLNGGGSMWFNGEWYGNPSWPVDRLMVEALLGAFAIMPIIIAIFYGGELVWRDRDRKVHEIVDATAAPDWAHLLPKVLAIAGVLVASALAGALAGVGVQLAKGYTGMQLMHYLAWFVVPATLGAGLLAVMSVFVQVLVPHKSIGWAVMLLQLVAAVALGSAGFEHNLYNYGGTPTVPLSDMNGRGRFWVAEAWFFAYWWALALALGVASYALWRRGAHTALRARLVLARTRLRGPAGGLLATALLAWVGLGGWIFYNTNVRNEYSTAPQREELQAQAEKDLLRFEAVPQPRITTVTVDVQLYPQEPRASTSGQYTLDNPRGVPITELHVNWHPRMRLDRLEIDGGGATLKQDWPAYHYRIYTLARPMQPGETRTLRFASTVAQPGFVNSNPLVRVVDNGSFLDNSEITPSLGISRDAFLKDRAKRRKHGLPPDLRPPTLEDEAGRAHTDFRRDSDWVRTDITVGTDADQTPIAPGQKLSDSSASGRRVARFVSDAPINHFYSIQSARYAVLQDSWAGPHGAVDLAVYYHPGHVYNVARMMDAMKRSLALFSEQFSPYQFKQARILEFPSYANFAQSFANTIPYSENIGFIQRHTDPEKIDMVSYVTAHEIAHQWWGHQLVPSAQQGGTLLVESMAQYSALLVMERQYGRAQMRRFLKYELDRYLRARGGEVAEELPLARVENQGYIHYQKGSLAMYWLKEVVGEAVVNRALARLLQAHAFKAAPYPNSTDFLTLLRQEAGPQHDALITDLFEKITLLDLKTTAARSRRLADGRFELTLTVSAKKVYADGTGQETEVPMDELVDIGAFTDEPGKAGFQADSVLQLARQRIRSGMQTVTLLLPKAPTWAGIDPYNKRIDRNTDDNLMAVVAQP